MREGLAKGDEEEEADPEEPDDADMLDEIDGQDVRGGESGPKHQQIGGLGDMLGATVAQPKDKASKAKRRKKDVKEQDDDQDEEMGEEAASHASSRLQQLLHADPEMHVVATRHGKVTGRPTPPCLFNLVIDQVIRNPGKLGHTINGVSCTVLFVCSVVSWFVFCSVEKNRVA